MRLLLSENSKPFVYPSHALIKFTFKWNNFSIIIIIIIIIIYVFIYYLFIHSFIMYILFYLFACLFVVRLLPISFSLLMFF